MLAVALTLVALMPPPPPLKEPPPEDVLSWTLLR
jgi:hypothetical protein